MATPDLRNTSINSLYGMFDMSGTRRPYTDGSGEFDIFPLSNSRCSRSDAIDTGYGTCTSPDGGTNIRYNNNADRDQTSELSRHNIVIFINSEIANGMELNHSLKLLPMAQIQILEGMHPMHSQPQNIE